MAEADDARDMAQQAPNPDAQTTVNDFLDYTEFFPSDLVRSLTLIGDLDANYRDAVQQVHDLTALYGQLPTLPEQARADPVLLRKQIAQSLQKAISQREYAYTEASRLHEVAVRHCQRSSVIVRKLQAQPEPPSRDPTPPPVSPTAQRSYHRNYERAPHLRLTFDGGRHGATGAPLRDRHKKPGALPLRRARAYSASSDSSGGESDLRSNIDLVAPHRKLKLSRDRSGARVRAQGVLGTNVHSAVAGISTSNALAQLAVPPADAAPGSKWAPWMKLTEYEMALLRKHMKKNAVWTPSLTMVNRELERKHRTRADYEREKARCENAGEDLLDEVPESLQDLMTASGLGQLASSGPVLDAADAQDDSRDDGGTISIRLKPAAPNDGRKLDRLSQRQQAMRDAQELENATSKLQQAADSLKELTFTSHSVTTPASQKKRSASRPEKRKRDTTPPPTAESTAGTPRESSVATQDSGTKQPNPKRLRLQEPLTAAAFDDTTSPAPTHASELSTPQKSPWSVELSPTTNTHIPEHEANEAANDVITVQVPLAPAGPSTPKVPKAALQYSSRPSTPAVLAPLERKASPATVQGIEIDVSVTPSPPVPVLTLQHATTAASSRPRRESVAPKALSPPAAPVQLLKTSKPSTPVLESIPAAPVSSIRPRSSRGHVPTPKAQSEEPKPNDLTRISRETRRHSVFSQPALTAPAATRMSTRKKPPPKGEVTAAEDGQKTVTNVKRAQGSKNNKKKKAEEELETADEIDPDETTYCVCDDVSYGAMISCDNNVSDPSFALTASAHNCSVTSYGFTYPA
jgi:hypothetical protein